MHRAYLGHVHCAHDRLAYPLDLILLNNWTGDTEMRFGLHVPGPYGSVDRASYERFRRSCIPGACTCTQCESEVCIRNHIPLDSQGALRGGRSEVHENYRYAIVPPLEQSVMLVLRFDPGMVSSSYVQ